MLDYLIDDIDLVLVMSVNPGFGGQSFISSQLRKIEAVRKMIDKTGRAIDLEVDGGIDRRHRAAGDRRRRRRAGRGNRDLPRRAAAYAANIAALRGGMNGRDRPRFRCRRHRARANG